MGKDSFAFSNYSRIPSRPEGEEEGTVLFPELEQTGIDEKKLRESPFGKILFGVLDILFPVFSEPNWFDVYDPPLSKEENLDLPYFDGYDFVNSTWTIYIRHRYGPFNWLNRMGFVPQTVNRVFKRGRQDHVERWFLRRMVYQSCHQLFPVRKALWTWCWLRAVLSRHPNLPGTAVEFRARGRQVLEQRATVILKK